MNMLPLFLSKQAHKPFAATTTSRSPLNKKQTTMETVKNAVAAVNEGVASIAQSAAESLGTVHDKA